MLERQTGKQTTGGRAGVRKRTSSARVEKHAGSAKADRVKRCTNRNRASTRSLYTYFSKKTNMLTFFSSLLIHLVLCSGCFSHVFPSCVPFSFVFFHCFFRCTNTLFVSLIYIYLHLSRAVCVRCYEIFQGVLRFILSTSKMCPDT